MRSSELIMITLSYEFDSGMVGQNRKESTVNNETCTMIEFIKEGFGLIITIVIFVLIVLLALGHEERKKNSEKLFFKNTNTSNGEENDGCLVSIFNGIANLVLWAVIIAFVLGMIFLLLKFIAYPGDRM